MPDITYDYQPSDEVYVIVDCGKSHSVLPAKVIKVAVEVVSTKTTIEYTVSTSLSNSEIVSADDIYATKESAITAYTELVD